MAGVIVLLLLVILSPPLFTHQAKNFAVALDYKFIQSVCNISDTPETCTRCVQSSKGPVSNGVEIAIAIVNCINDKANTLALNLTKLASTSDTELKSICQRCAKGYGDNISKKVLISSKHDLQNHNYDNAESSVVSALSFDLSCHSDLKIDYHDKVPSYVFNDMKIFEELSEAASRIIEKL